MRRGRRSRRRHEEEQEEEQAYQISGTLHLGFSVLKEKRKKSHQASTFMDSLWTAAEGKDGGVEGWKGGGVEGWKGGMCRGEGTEGTSQKQLRL